MQTTRIQLYLFFPSSSSSLESWFPLPPPQILTLYHSMAEDLVRFIRFHVMEMRLILKAVLDRTTLTSYFVHMPMMLV